MFAFEFEEGNGGDGQPRDERAHTEIEAAYARKSVTTFIAWNLLLGTRGARTSGSLERRVAQKVADAWCDSSQATMWRGGAREIANRGGLGRTPARSSRGVRSRGRSRNQRTPRANRTVVACLACVVDSDHAANGISRARAPRRLHEPVV